MNCIHCIKWMLLLVSQLTVIAETAYTSVVLTTSGPIRGEKLISVRKFQEYAAFKGIPFAEPPIGYLRFKPPVPKAKWYWVKSTVSEGPACLQYDQFNLTMTGSEDCLYLNIFTPHLKFRKSLKKPVMVWIYGGGFMVGYPNTHLYGPDYLIEKDVIVVSMNYRLGTLGFLNLAHENATGNAGLKDQNLALKWINNNIERFGGDPNKITIFGQSAGAVSVDLHSLSEMSAGLFNRSIAMSGSILNQLWPLQKPKETEYKARLLAADYNIRPFNKELLLKRLYAQTAEDLLKNTILMFNRPSIETAVPFGNQERFIKTCPLSKLKSGGYMKAPHMMGVTSLETIAFAPHYMIFLLQINPNNDGKENSEMLDIDELLKIPAISRLFNFFQTINSNRLFSILGGIYKRLLSVTSHLFFNHGVNMKQDILSKSMGHPVYYYRSHFTAGLPKIANDKTKLEGLGHMEDLAYIFHMPIFNLSLKDDKTSKVIDMYTSLWTNFAIYGEPTPYQSELLLGWPDSCHSGQILNLNWPPNVISKPEPYSSKLLAIGSRLLSRILDKFYAVIMDSKC